ncbi:glycoside hydrolase family 127 protein [Paenibacillus sp. CAU 1782]
MHNKAESSYSRQLGLKHVTVTDSYWSRHISLIRDTVIPYQWEALNDRIPDAEPSRAISNFEIAAGRKEGEFSGFVFQDTDLYKWLEAVGFALAAKRDEELEKIADGAIDLIASAQQADGYLNTYFTVAAPGQQWTNLMDCHEMYTAGHLIEAAVAYYQSTGKSKLLEVAKRFADHIDSRFGTEPGKIRGYDGHQEIELALVKLYEVTGEDKYRKLASFLIDERGQEPSFFLQEWEKRGRISYWSPGVVQTKKPALEYQQALVPVREQSEAVGHSVRAVYMYTAMADLAMHNGDRELLDACKRLWSNMVNKQMYITGGIGSTNHGEAFTFDYDLPNDTNYSETCASIGLIFFARRMLQLEPLGEYGDVMERALYNTVTAGIAGDGKHYFYVNPMEVWPEASRRNPSRHHVKAVRQKWYGCACCPPNVARILSSLGHYIFTASSDTVYTHLYIGNETSLEIGGRKTTLKLQSDLPWDGNVILSVSAAEGSGVFTIALRFPAWSRKTVFTLNGEVISPEVSGGYAYISRDWRAGDEIGISLDMTPQRIYANPLLRANAGRVSLQRGPLVYCLEETDNGAPLASLSLPPDSEIVPVRRQEDGAVLLEARGQRVLLDDEKPDQLYRTSPFRRESVKLVAAPYTLWGNRNPGEMTVWIRE